MKLPGSFEVDLRMAEGRAADYQLFEHRYLLSLE
jgi:hypothetical protein